MSVVSYPGREAAGWHNLVSRQTEVNFCVVYDTDFPENLELAELIRSNVWENDDESGRASWDRVKALLAGEEWFKKWVSNVKIDRHKKLRVYESGRFGFGNYQRAEMKWLRDHGLDFDVFLLDPLPDVLNSIKEEALHRDWAGGWEWEGELETLRWEPYTRRVGEPADGRWEKGVLLGGGKKKGKWVFVWRRKR